MNNKFKLTLVVLLLLLLPFKPFAQQPYRQYADEGIMLNFFEIGNPDLRLYLLYNIGLDDRFSLLAEDEYGQFIVNPSEDHFDGNFFEAFESFYNNAATNFRMIDKVDLDRLVPQWKERVPAMVDKSRCCPGRRVPSGSGVGRCSGVVCRFSTGCPQEVQKRASSSSLAPQPAQRRGSGLRLPHLTQ